MESSSFSISRLAQDILASTSWSSRSLHLKSCCLSCTFKLLSEPSIYPTFFASLSWVFSFLIWFYSCWFWATSFCSPIFWQFWNLDSCYWSSWFWSSRAAISIWARYLYYLSSCPSSTAFGLCSSSYMCFLYYSIWYSYISFWLEFSFSKSFILLTSSSYKSMILVSWI